MGAGHGGHGSHCGTERCHGTVFGRTVHHWKPESFHWWLCQAGPQGKELKLAGVFVSFVSPIFGLTWIFHMMEKKSKGFCQVHQDLYHDHFGRQLATFDWTPCFETVTKHMFFPTRQQVPLTSTKKLLPKKNYYQTNKNQQILHLFR